MNWPVSPYINPHFEDFPAGWQATQHAGLSDAGQCDRGRGMCGCNASGRVNFAARVIANMSPQWVVIRAEDLLGPRSRGRIPSTFTAAINTVRLIVMGLGPAAHATVIDCNQTNSELRWEQTAMSP